MADFLVYTFFKYAQTNNFYVEEDWFLKKLDICYYNPSCLSSKDAGAVCSILMVLAVGTQFAHMESSASISSDGRSEDEYRFSEDEVGLTFYQFASKLLPEIITISSVRSVQACLLIGTYLLPLDTSGLCYTYFGLAVKMAIQNGMHRRYHGAGFSSRMMEVRNRVFWTAYTIEKYAPSLPLSLSFPSLFFFFFFWRVHSSITTSPHGRRISILHGKPSSLSDSDVDAALPVDFPELKPSGQPSNHTNMVSLITLTLKMGEAAHDMYVPPPATKKKKKKKKKK